MLSDYPVTGLYTQYCCRQSVMLSRDKPGRAYPCGVLALPVHASFCLYLSAN